MNILNLKEAFIVGINGQMVLERVQKTKRLCSVSSLLPNFTLNAKYYIGSITYTPPKRIHCNYHFIIIMKGVPRIF